MQDLSAMRDRTIGYEAPQNLAAVLQLLQQHGDNAKLLAGGQSLLVLLRKGFIEPDVLVSIRQVEELRGISFAAGGGMTIGAAVTQAALERSTDVRQHYTALSDAAAVVASAQVRNQGTLGGNLCHADPTADPPAALIALGATLELVRPRGTRTLPVETFFQDFLEVDLQDNEILARILLPPPVARSSSVYLKHRLRQVDTAIVGIAVWLQLNDREDLIQDVRIGLSGVGVTPLRAVEAEHVLRGMSPEDEIFERAAEVAAAHCEPLDDTEASAWYRREMVVVLLRRALSRVIQRIHLMPVDQPGTDSSDGSGSN